MHTWLTRININLIYINSSNRGLFFEYNEVNEYGRP